MKKYKIACIIVTYNRKALLKNCLDAVDAQIYKPHTVYITDNASTDGTIDSVKEWGYYESKKNGVRYKYILNPKNEGGAGGFHLGMKTAYEEGLYDGIWVMDDDGVPDADCLNNQIRYLSKCDYIAPLVLCINDASMTAFMGSLADLSDKIRNGIIEDRANPFNGILFSTKLVSKIGFPKKEMFIWGDEINYDKRAKIAGFRPVVVMNALHRHPLDRQVFYYPHKGVKIRVSDTPWKMYCYIRNYIFNYHIDHTVLQTIRFTFAQIFNYSSYYIDKKQYRECFMVLDAAFAGYFGYWNGMGKYFKS